MNLPARAAVDIGSNSVKLVLARSAAELDAPVLDAVRICGLGSGVGRSGRLEPAAMGRAEDALAELVALARERGATDFAAVGTKALRAAANRADFLARVRERCGLEIEVIDGLAEAALSFRAGDSALGPARGRRLLFDVGGGSTEFMLGEGGRLTRRISLDLGCLSLSERWQRSDPITAAERRGLDAELDRALADILPAADELVGIGGTVTSLGTVALALEEWRPERLRGLALDAERIAEQQERFVALPIAERARIPGLLPARAPVIVAGAAIVLAILRATGQRGLRLSQRALRHGLWLERFGS